MVCSFFHSFIHLLWVVFGSGSVSGFLVAGCVVVDFGVCVYGVWYVLCLYCTVDYCARCGWIGWSWRL